MSSATTGNRRDGQYRALVDRYGADILASPGMERSRGHIQHGDTSVCDHSVSVALMCLDISRRLRLRVDERTLVRGALLHDYFLYDWHVKDPGHRWHGFTHPRKSLNNAKRDFALGEVEADMIACHMFPLTPKPPTHAESWVLWVADKLCSAREILRRGKDAPSSP